MILLYLAHKECSGIIKGWLYCLTLESKGRFLANNILFGLACLVIAQVQFFFTKNKKKQQQRFNVQNTRTHQPPPLRPITSHFWLSHQHPFPPKVDIICVSPLTKLLHLSEFSLDIVSRVKYVKFQ